jgi:leucine dehydrogenase
VIRVTELPTPGYEKVLRAEEPETGLRAVVAVHSTRLGPAIGGVRMWPYRSWEEAQQDALRLARAMTYKSALAGTGCGGGKAVLVGNPKTDKTEALFRALGRLVQSLGGAFVAGEDVGTVVEDMVCVRAETRWVLGLPRSMGSSGDPSPWTALGCVHGMRACLEEVHGGPAFEGRTVVVQGAGHMGDHLARRLAEAGATIVVTDLSPEAARETAARTGATAVAPDRAYEIPCDVFAPCALGAVLNDATIPRLQCRIVAGGANNQLLREEHGDRLRERGILYAPDYVVNAGGLLNAADELSPGGYDEERVRRKVEAIGTTLREVFRLAREKGVATNRASNMLAEARLA